MSNVVEVIKTMAQLIKYANEHGVLEVVTRSKDGKIAKMSKLLINNAAKSNAATQQAANTLISTLNNINPLMGGLNLAGTAANTAIGLKSLQMLGTITKLSKFNILLTGVNLCATCAGFAIMFKKLDKMSAKIDEVLNAVKTSHKAYVNYELKKILSEHNNMLDCRRLHKPYSAEKMRELVDAEYNVLDLLIEAFLDNSTGDSENLIFSIYSLASMLSASVIYFDETYYFTNKEIITDGKVWHPSHDSWTAVLDKIISAEFVARIQDHGMFELDLSTEENDYFYKSLSKQIVDLKTEIEDNQTLLKAFDDEMNYKKYFEILNQDIKETISQAFDEAGIETDNTEISEAVNDAFEKISVA